LRNKIREEEEIGQEIVFLFHITSIVFHRYNRTPFNPHALT
jgi:hypothetical protein